MSTAVVHAADRTQRKRTTELADIVRLCQTDLHSELLSPTQRKALGAILACRTPKLGGQRFDCDDCGYQRFVYHSCRHRACPKCQTQARQQWRDARIAELLPVPYFHLVFTLPHSLNALVNWSEKNQRTLLDLLFQTASRTLLEFGKSRLQGTIGITMVLHTWTQQLQSHHHVHCVVPAGALSLDKTKWQVAGRKFLFPVHALSKVFRGKYVAGLRTLLADEAIDLPPHLQQALSSRVPANDWLHCNLMSQSWVVYSQAPFGGPGKVLEYLSRYTHRTAIGNERIMSCRDGHVRFRWRDRRNNDVLRSMSLPIIEFVKRFASHVLPDGFMRIRHYGLLANRGKAERLNKCRRLLGQRSRDSKPIERQSAIDWLSTICGINESVCPCCQTPLRVTTIPRPRFRPYLPSPAIMDSS